MLVAQSTRKMNSNCKYNGGGNSGSINSHLHQTMEFQIVNYVMLMVNQTHLLTLSLLLLCVYLHVYVSLVDIFYNKRRKRNKEGSIISNIRKNGP